MTTKTYFTILLAGTLFFGCENKEKEEAYQNRISELEGREQELQQQVQEKDAAFVALMESMASIEKNLREIRAREMNIEMTRQDEDLSPEDLRNHISEDIAVIDRLISENKQAIRNLSTRVRSFQQENGQLNTTMEKLRDDFNQNKFTRIDIREQVSFPVDGKEVELVTVHSPDSYKIEEEASGDMVNLVVSAPQKFWQSSKYLVMLIK